ncbi:MAG: DUF134 domain-containing protein [Bacteroidales bacterium]|nr:DUF134 domain-containing protein [Bacteroidales bacterium]
MPRPKNERIVHEPPLFTEFKPGGVYGRDLDLVVITLDEYEAFRLADHIGLSHEEAAGEMEISRSTFTRLIEDARKKIAGLIIEGKKLVIEGGSIHFRSNIIRCAKCGYMFKTGINAELIECPECHSTELISLAGGFGHGRCCGQYRNSKNQHKKGGNYARRRQNRS